MPHMVCMQYQHEAQGLARILCMLYVKYTPSIDMHKSVIHVRKLYSQLAHSKFRHVRTAALVMCVILGWVEFTDDSISERTCGGC